MKYAIVYNKPESDRVRRTRFVGKRMANRKRASLKARGFETSVLPRTEFDDNVKVPSAKINPRASNQGTLWRFIPKHHQGEYIGLICIKNGQNKAMHNLP